MKIKNFFKSRIIFIKETISIDQNIMLSGEIPVNAVNPISSFVKKDSTDGFEEDTVVHEQFMIVKGSKGIYIFVGCSHPGILNCVAHAKDLFPDANICALEECISKSIIKISLFKLLLD